MKKTYVASALTAAVVIASASLAVMRSTPVSAQSATADRSANANASAPSKAIPRTADGHPDMTGVWWPGHDLIPAQATAVRRTFPTVGRGRVDELRRPPEDGCVRWYWWTAISVALLLMILAAVAVTSFLKFLHTAN